MAICDWPEEERPREKLLQRGAKNLSDAELLAIFLRTGVKGLSALDLARKLLLVFEGVRGILEANEIEFCQQHGLGLSKYAQLQAVLELSQRHMLESLKRDGSLTSSNLTREYVQAKMRAYSREVFLCLYLDNQHRLIAEEELFFGTLMVQRFIPVKSLKALFCIMPAQLFLSTITPPE
jgi:DNA repair protein RadC